MGLPHPRGSLVSRSPQGGAGGGLCGVPKPLGGGLHLTPPSGPDRTDPQTPSTICTPLPLPGVPFPLTPPQIAARSPPSPLRAAAPLPHLSAASAMAASRLPAARLRTARAPLPLAGRRVNQPRWIAIGRAARGAALGPPPPPLQPIRERGSVRGRAARLRLPARLARKRAVFPGFAARGG